MNKDFDDVNNEFTNNVLQNNLKETNFNNTLPVDKQTPNNELNNDSLINLKDGKDNNNPKTFSRKEKAKIFFESLARSLAISACFTAILPATVAPNVKDKHKELIKDMPNNIIKKIDVSNVTQYKVGSTIGEGIGTLLGALVLPLVISGAIVLGPFALIGFAICVKCNSIKDKIKTGKEIQNDINYVYSIDTEKLKEINIEKKLKIAKELNKLIGTYKGESNDFIKLKQHEVLKSLLDSYSKEMVNIKSKEEFKSCFEELNKIKLYCSKIESNELDNKFNEVLKSLLDKTSTLNESNELKFEDFSEIDINSLTVENCTDNINKCRLVNLSNIYNINSDLIDIYKNFALNEKVVDKLVDFINEAIKVEKPSQELLKFVGNACKLLGVVLVKGKININENKKNEINETISGFVNNLDENLKENKTINVDEIKMDEYNSKVNNYNFMKNSFEMLVKIDDLINKSEENKKIKIKFDENNENKLLSVDSLFLESYELEKLKDPELNKNENFNIDQYFEKIISRTKLLNKIVPEKDKERFSRHVDYVKELIKIYPELNNNYDHDIKEILQL